MIISGSDFVTKLIEAGVVKHGDKLRRVVIDAVIGQPVKLYVERFGDDRMLRVATTLEGVEIVNVQTPAEG